MILIKLVINYSTEAQRFVGQETFSALLAICAGNSPVTGEFPTQRPVTWTFDVFFDLRLNKRLVRLVIWDAIAPIVTSL